MYTRWIRGDTREDMSTSILMERSSKLVRRVAPLHDICTIQDRDGSGSRAHTIPLTSKHVPYNEPKRLELSRIEILFD